MKKLFAALSLSLIAVAASTSAQAADPQTITLVLKDHKFTPSEIDLPANTPVIFLIKNQDSAVEEFDSHDLNREKIIAPHMEAKVRINGLAPGDYQFMGEFHSSTAQGVVHVK